MLRKPILWLASVFLAPALVFFAVQSIYDRSNATSDIEFRVTKVGELLRIPQGFEEAKVSFRGQYKNVNYVELEIFNRTAKSFSEVPIQFHLREGAKLLYTAGLSPTEQDNDRFSWDAKTPLVLQAKSINASWHNSPVYTVHFFFDAGQIPDIWLSTSKAGVEFAPYDDSKAFLFPHDTAVAGTLVGLFLLSSAIYGVYLLASSQQRRQVDAFGRVFTFVLNKEIASAPETPPSAIATKQLLMPHVVQIAKAVRAAQFGQSGDVTSDGLVIVSAIKHLTEVKKAEERAKTVTAVA